ncbi:MAG: RNA polymerase sigma factor [Deltaproteobacteria bacterium]|nr:MAG: RNA polymerase sigma factor [Deltaproteobacteria bacterium]
MSAAHHLALVPDTDSEVVTRVLGGDVPAFEILMRRYNQRVFRTVRAVLHDEDAAEDAAQQTWINAYKHLGSFEGRARFSTWLLRIAVNQASRDVRKSRSHLQLATAPRAEAEADTPEAEAARVHLRSILESAIDSLPEPLRVVLILRDVEELSGSETAAILDLTDEAARVRLHRARRQLRGSLETVLEDGVGEAYPFLGARCNSIVAAVFTAIAD